MKNLTNLTFIGTCWANSELGANNKQLKNVAITKRLIMNGLQYLTDSQGDKTHVLISMKDWHQLANHVEEIRRLEAIAHSIKQGIREAKDMEAGNIVTSSTKDFLDAL